jgi:hypothetical protein
VRPSDAVSGPEYAALVVLLAVGIIGAALFVAWAAEQRGILAPGTVPIPHHEAEADGPGPDPAE